MYVIYRGKAGTSQMSCMSCIAAVYFSTQMTLFELLSLPICRLHSHIQNRP